jgi:hypothetical protein
MKIIKPRHHSAMERPEDWNRQTYAWHVAGHIWAGTLVHTVHLDQLHPTYRRLAARPDRFITEGGHVAEALFVAWSNTLEAPDTFGTIALRALLRLPTEIRGCCDPDGNFEDADEEILDQPPLDPEDRLLLFGEILALHWDEINRTAIDQLLFPDW